jgi:hypothetical protein
LAKSGADQKRRGIDKLVELVSSSDFPDHELAENIEKASREFRKSLKIREARAF